MMHPPDCETRATIPDKAVATGTDLTTSLDLQDMTNHMGLTTGFDPGNLTGQVGTDLMTVLNAGVSTSQVWTTQAVLSTC